MQFVSVLSTAALVASVSALRATTSELNKECDTNKAYAEIINRCDYDVNLWSVYRGTGCPTSGGNMVTLKKGGVYRENLFESKTDDIGISIKVSKTEECKGSDIVQLEYYLESRKEEKFNLNYLDVSYVDCLGNDCPTKQEGYYLVSGSQEGNAKASNDNTWCPILSCHDPISCAKCSYILPDDVQTKTCDKTQNLKFYMCGGEAPTEDYDSAPASSKPVVESKPAPAPTSTSTKDDSYIAKAAAVTPEPLAPKVKTEIVYVTEYAYVNAKRHGHARRHGNRRA